MCNLGNNFVCLFPQIHFLSSLFIFKCQKSHCQYQIWFVPYLLYLDSKIVDSWGHDFQFSVAFLMWGPSIILHWAVPSRTWDFTMKCQGQIVFQDNLPLCTVVQLIDLDIVFPDFPRKFILAWVLVFFTLFQADVCFQILEKTEAFYSCFHHRLSHQFSVPPRKAMSLTSVSTIF